MWCQVSGGVRCRVVSDVGWQMAGLAETITKLVQAEVEAETELGNKSVVVQYLIKPKNQILSSTLSWVWFCCQLKLSLAITNILNEYWIDQDFCN